MEPIEEEAKVSEAWKGKTKCLEELRQEQLALTGEASVEQKPSSIIKLNVGGDTSFVTSRDTLTAIEGSRLSQLFSGRWDKVLPKDSNGRIFLDLDPVQFRALLSWLVDIKRLPPGSTVQGPPLKTLPPEYQAGFLELCELLCSKEASKSTSSCNQTGTLLDEGDDNIMFDSQILGSEDQQRLKNWIQHESCPSKGCNGNLLFRATRDGFPAANFHQKCDGKGPTVVIAKSAGGHIFGGYTEAAWDSSNQWKNCRDSFLFRLSGPGGVGPSQHRIFQSFEWGIYCYSNQGPIFGQDMYFMNNSQVNFQNFGNAYNPNGLKFLAESQNVTITEYEVFEFVPRVTYESVKKGLVGELKKCGDQMNGDHYELLSKALEITHAVLALCAGLQQKQVSIAAECEAVEGEVQFMRRFLGRCHEDSIVQLNVSGVAMETFRSTLMRQEGSTLAAKFGSAWTVQSEEMVDGGVFFDEDPSLFSLLLLHLRLDSMLGQSFIPRVPDEKLGAWKRFIKYLNLDDALTPDAAIPPDDMKLDSLILADLTKELKQLSAWLPNKKTTLLFRATRDGFAPANFHRKCDGKGPTLVIAKSAGGHIFGGYTEAAWDSSNQWKNCRDSFLFRLSGPGGVGPSQHCIVQNFQNGIRCLSNHGPVFGQDMYMHSSKVNFQNLGYAYNPNGFKFLAESHNGVTISESEVFSLEDD